MPVHYIFCYRFCFKTCFFLSGCYDEFYFVDLKLIRSNCIVVNVYTTDNRCLTKQTHVSKIMTLSDNGHKK